MLNWQSKRRCHFHCSWHHHPPHAAVNRDAPSSSVSAKTLAIIRVLSLQGHLNIDAINTDAINQATSKTHAWRHCSTCVRRIRSIPVLDIKSVAFGGGPQLLKSPLNIDVAGASSSSSSSSSSSCAALLSQWPSVWHSWSTLLARIGPLVGEIATFKSEQHMHGDVRLDGFFRAKDEDRKKRICTVDRYWRSWLETEMMQIKMQGKDTITTYMVDVDVPAALHSDLLLTHPVYRLYGPFGLYCMHQYLPLSLRDLRHPPLVNGGPPGSLVYPGLRLFISPPTHRRLSTSTHTDGHGYFVTVHSVAPCSNANTRNRVQTWDRKQAGLPDDVSELYAFGEDIQRALDIAVNGGTVKVARQHLSSDVSKNGAFDHDCSSLLTAAGLHPGETTHVSRGDTIVQPPGLLHHYQKELIDPGAHCARVVGKGKGKPPSDPYTANEGIGGPMVGAAGTDVLLGRDRKEADENLRILTAHAAKMRVANLSLSGTRKHGTVVSCLRIDLPLWLGILCAGIWPESLVITASHQAHFDAASPLIEELINSDRRVHSDILTKQGKIGDCTQHVVLPMHQSDPSISGAGILVSCSCVNCGSHIFHHFYAAFTASKISGNWCGACVLAIAVPVQFALCKRFKVGEEIANVWTMSKQRWSSHSKSKFK